MYAHMCTVHKYLWLNLPANMVMNTDQICGNANGHISTLIHLHYVRKYVRICTMCTIFVVRMFTYGGPPTAIVCAQELLSVSTVAQGESSCH